MGKGGESAPAPPQLSTHWTSPYNPLDPKAPKLPTKGEIKAVIPKECFERSYTKGLSWVLFDVGIVALLVFTAKSLLSTTPPQVLISAGGLFWVLGWSLYAFCMGSTLWGVWTLAHECGHGALFPSRMCNEIFGFILYQAILKPFFPWRYIHSKHHQYTNNLHRDTHWSPDTLSDIGMRKEKENMGENNNFLASVLRKVGNGPFSACFLLFVGTTYTSFLFGVGAFCRTCRTNYDGTPSKQAKFSILNPWSKLLPPKLRAKSVLSTLTFAASIAGLAKLAFDHTLLSVALWYGFPIVLLYFWGFIYSFLHHTDPSVPVYGNDEWTWMRGALTTIDRDYGIFNIFHHQMGSTHVVHHLFHEVPFYNSVKATTAVREFLEPKGLYNFDPTPWWKALWRTFRKCQYIDDTSGVQYKRSFDDIVPMLREFKKE